LEDDKLTSRKRNKLDGGENLEDDEARIMGQRK